MARPRLVTIVPVGVYGTEVAVAVTAAAGVRWARRHGASDWYADSYREPADGRAGFWSDADGFTRYMVVIGSRGRRAANTAAHEAVHVAYAILDERGVDHSRDSHEAFAYLVGYLTEWFVSAVRRYEDGQPETPSGAAQP